MKDSATPGEPNEQAVLKLSLATNEEVNTTAKESNYNDYDQYEKIYLQHMEEIQTLEKRQMVSKVGFLIGLVIFFIMLAIKVQLEKSFSYLYLLIPAYLTLVSMTVLANSYLLLKEVFDNAHRMVREERSEGCSLGTILSLICLNMCAICVLLYITLLAIKIDNPEILPNVTFNLISIPVYLSMGFCVFFFIFILPALLFHGYYFSILVICGYIVASFITFLMLNLKLDKSLLGNTFVNILTPMLVAYCLHLLYLITKFAFEKEENDRGFVINLIKFFGMAGLFASTVLIALKADGRSTLPNWVPVILLGISFYMANEYGWNCEDDAEEEKEKERDRERV
jgi:hypothetical protein